ncbi:MAG: hypothetical protein IKO00_04470 [Oscillospiraceae bacterium]|jgi:hypothetical protein|nr:hypothetical protein [Oscillospiraceae bacterium]
MENAIIDLSAVIGVYPICNTGAVLVHAIDYGEGRVLASVNGADPEWCGLTEEYMETTEELELGFRLGELFIPFCEVMRFTGGAI